jgi:hypothetical protein
MREAWALVVEKVRSVDPVKFDVEIGGEGRQNIDCEQIGFRNRKRACDEDAKGKG